MYYDLSLLDPTEGKREIESEIDRQGEKQLLTTVGLGFVLLSLVNRRTAETLHDTTKTAEWTTIAGQNQPMTWGS